MTWSNDPVRDANEWFARGADEAEAREEANARCIECGYIIRSEMCVVLNSLAPFFSSVCPDCESKAVTALARAGLPVLSDEVHEWFTDYRMETPNEFDEMR